MMPVVRVRISDDLYEIFRDLPLSEIMRNALYLYVLAMSKNGKSENILSSIVREGEIQLEKLMTEKKFHELRIKEIDIQIEKLCEFLQVLKEKGDVFREYVDHLRKTIKDSFSDVDIRKLKSEQIKNRLKLLSKETGVPEPILNMLFVQVFGNEWEVKDEEHS